MSLGVSLALPHWRRGSAPNPGPGPGPSFDPPNPERLLYWVSADHGAGSVDGNPVASWTNRGTKADVVQSVEIQRPIYRTGGLNGYPYIECQGNEWFEDLEFDQPTGVTVINPFTVFVVTDDVDVSEGLLPITGSTATNGGKVGFYFRPAVDEQIHFVKTQLRIGNVANPQVMMAAVGRNAAGATSNGFSRFWIRQNRAAVWDAALQSANLPSGSNLTTQFLRSTGLTGEPGYRGRLYEFFFYDGILDDAGTFAIEDYLMTKYGIV